MPKASALPVVPPSQVEFPAAATPDCAIVTLRLAANDSAALSMVLAFWTRSLPDPVSMPAAVAFEVELLSEMPKPPATVTPTDAVDALASVSMSAPSALVTTSSPPPPRRPSATDVAVVPPSQILSIEPAAPPEMATFTVTAVASDSTSTSPEFWIRSSSPPPSMALASVSAVAVDDATAAMPPTENVTEGATTTASTSISPLLMSRSSPSPPAMAAAVASPEVPPSTELTATPTPAPVSATLTPTATASE